MDGRSAGMRNDKRETRRQSWLSTIYKKRTAYQFARDLNEYNLITKIIHAEHPVISPEDGSPDEGRNNRSFLLTAGYASER